ncbi:phosphonate metabolism protein PhnM [Caldicellulosiruptor morganii]|uniref:Phosphonate metabolism protein PhnM n=1 Tax=Caldicellulosiruptor morganii TaxID=1387555 RepID=A0ABY7BPY5_9FIRM|nr:phosphonate metabolism protein PhnM [Caldicellulosiruptor morganii]WAM33474.1 phosphonate metabolism protein PhnM [Caldicellulosiruptor morganii]
MNNSFVITNAKIVMPDRIINKGSIFIKNGWIYDISKKIVNNTSGNNILNVNENFVLPGFIDLHSDAIEAEIEPRPKANFSIDLAFRELEKKIAGNGITTIFHSISFSDREVDLRKSEVAKNIIEKIYTQSQEFSLIRNRIHLRFEVTNTKAIDTIMQFVTKKMVDILSFMDHTPGQGQFKYIEEYERYMAFKFGFSSEKVKGIITKKRTSWSDIYNDLSYLANQALENNIILVSHDDDSPQKVKEMKKLGVKICEFPVNIETAKTAYEEGMNVCVGAPNILRGGSLTNNLSAIEAIKKNYVQIICSDYYPNAILHAIFKLVKEGISLTDAVNMVSLNPAKAVGIDRYFGSIEIGKKADLVIVDCFKNIPLIVKTFVDGCLVYSIQYRKEIKQDEH